LDFLVFLFYLGGENAKRGAVKKKNAYIQALWGHRAFKSAYFGQGGLLGLQGGATP
jgi:hypothetical protein